MAKKREKEYILAILIIKSVYLSSNLTKNWKYAFDVV